MLVQSEQASSALGNALDETRNDETKTKLKTNIFIFFLLLRKKTSLFKTSNEQRAEIEIVLKIRRLLVKKSILNK
jgi:hypothetical protein